MPSVVRRFAAKAARRLGRWVVAGDHGAYHIAAASGYLGGVKGASVLVAGCNTGEECHRFIEAGAGRVTGVDVIEEVGAEFAHPNVEYHRMSIEDLSLPDGEFDLVYCFATLEHVGRIDLAYPELVRVTRPSGIVYCVAAPLWNSRVGHHKGDIFESFPWIHLALDRDEILVWCSEQELQTFAGLPIEAHVDYMLNDEYFNKHPAASYVDVCARLQHVDVIAHTLAFDAAADLQGDLAAKLAAKGYSTLELAASVHTFVARRT